MGEMNILDGDVIANEVVNETNKKTSLVMNLKQILGRHMIQLDRRSKGQLLFLIVAP